MKLIKTILISGIGVLAAAAVSSCDLTTDSPSTFTEDKVFADPTMTEYQLFSAYNAFTGTNAHRGRYLPYYGYNTDIEWYLSSTKNEVYDLVFYRADPSNTRMNLSNGPYNEIYNGIERVNLTINGIRTYGDPENRPEMAALLGEALTLRAIFYTELLKAFGEVPARFAPVTPETMYLNKANKDDIYYQLLTDLEEAFDYMAWPSQSAATMTTTRASLALAKGLYARLALMASGYSLRPEDGQEGTGDPGRVRLTNDERLTKETLYPKAFAALQDVIDNSGLELLDYEELWRGFNNLDVTAGREIIWVFPFDSGRGRWNYTFAIRHEGYTTYSPSTSSRGGTAGPVPYLFYMYDDNDVRRDISCVNYRWETDNLPHPAGIENWYFGKFRMEWMSAKPYDGGEDDGVKPVFMRYSDILLMAAEIANDEDGKVPNGQAYAKERIKEVRTRAYGGDADLAQDYVNSIGNTSNEIFEAIVKERALEFVGEFLRKSDLIRWNRLQKSMDDAAKELQAFRNGETGPLTGFDYSTLGTYCWYRHGTDSYGVPTIEMYGIHKGEKLDSPDERPAGSGWMPVTSSTGSVSRYFVTSALAGAEQTSAAFWVSNGTVDKATATGGFYDLNPDENQWWPIFQNSLTSSRNHLFNDYRYSVASE